MIPEEWLEIVKHPLHFKEILKEFKNPREKEDYYTLKEILEKKPKLNCTESALLAVEVFKRKGWDAFALSSISPQSIFVYPIMDFPPGIFEHTVVIVKRGDKYFLYDQGRNKFTPYIYWYIFEELRMIPVLLIKDFDDLFSKGIKNYKDKFKIGIEKLKKLFPLEIDRRYNFVEE